MEVFSMRKNQLFISIFAVAMLIGTALGARPRAHDDHVALLGTWVIDFKVAVSPKGNDFGQPHRHPFTFRDDDGQHIVTAKEVFEIRVPGAWRMSGSDFSAAFEFTCPSGVICGTVTMRGSLESETRMRGRVIVIWDEADETTPTGYDTITGTFTGEKCDKTIRSKQGDFGTQHDTGGCDSL
jgi:hypothetical protein